MRREHQPKQISGKIQRKEIVIIVSWLIASFCCYKLFFPHPIYTYDSYFYVEAAIRNLDISYWPIGYSKVIRWVHLVSAEDNFLVLLQYLLVELSAFALYFTIVFFWHSSLAIRRILFALVVCNPVLLIISNYILSDSIFIALTFGLLSILIWVINQPKPWMCFAVTAVFIVSFTIRYYAIFYPLLILPALFCAPGLSWRTKIISISFGVLMTATFVSYTSHKYAELIGRSEFSPFSGYRLAENAILMYQDPNSAEDMPEELQHLHSYVSTELLDRKRKGTDQASRVYYDIMDTSDVLNRYMVLDSKRSGVKSYFQQWASMGNLYGKYGGTLIEKHPVEYARNYLTKGIGWFFMPEIEITNEYKDGGYYVSDNIKRYFGYSMNILPCSRVSWFSITPYWLLYILSNMVYVWSCLGIIILHYLGKLDQPSKRLFIFMIGFWVANCLFNIVSSPCMFRYVIPVMITNTLMSILQVRFLIQSCVNANSK